MGFMICAQGRIRTSVAARASDLQSDAIDRSATCATLVILVSPFVFINRRAVFPKRQLALLPRLFFEPAKLLGNEVI